MGARSSTQSFTGFTTPSMEKQLKEDEDDDSKSSGGLEFTISQDEEDIEKEDIDQEDDSDSKPQYDLDSKDPLDVPAFMRKKK